MVNAYDRQELLKNLKKAEFTIEKEDLAFNYEELKKHDGRKIDKVYKFDFKSREMSENPHVKLAAYLKEPYYRDKTVRIEG